jgi:hypothetical protein
VSSTDEYLPRHRADDDVTKSSLKELFAYFSFSYDPDRVESDASSNSPIVTCVFVSPGICLPSRCLATIRGLNMYIQRDFYFIQNKERSLKVDLKRDNMD